MSDRATLWETVRAWYLPDSDDAELLGALESMRAQESWPRSPYDGSRRSLAAIKNLTSDLVGRFCGSVQAATFAASFGFMLPVSTPQNAIAYGSGVVPITKMIRSGLSFDILGAVLIVILLPVMVDLVLGSVS